MAKIKKIGLLILPAAIAVAAMFYLCRISVGFRISAICSLLTLSGLGTKTSPDFEYYKRMRNKNNPLLFVFES